jgi:hypothetical protein
MVPELNKFLQVFLFYFHDMQKISGIPWISRFFALLGGKIKFRDAAFVKLSNTFENLT